MFCRQCEQTANPCTKLGVCGKQPDTAYLQDLLTYALQGLATYAKEALKESSQTQNVMKRINKFTVEALFATLTNVNFDSEAIKNFIYEAVKLRDELKQMGFKVQETESCKFQPADNLQELVKQGEEANQKIFHSSSNEDVQSLKEITLYSLRGIAAYTDHAQILGQEDEKVYAFIYEALDAMQRNGDLDFWLNMVLRAGEINLRAMELLDAANTGRYGHPVPTPVPLGHKKGKAIVVSGHDLRDLELLLQQTEGKGIYVYTHGEMLPCHGYPELKKYKHFYGHYGTAWQNQQREFAQFPGAILMTTNCIIKPQESYKDRIFTTGVVGWPGVKHIKDKDFTPVIEKALELPGFTEDKEDKTVMVGFARNSVLSVADKVIELVKAGKIRHFFLVGGCDGAKPGRSYYTEFVEKTPKDTIVLTLACGKFRFFDKELGSINGIPRLLDVGQCNDAYSAIQIALALSKAFNVSINELPLSLILSWFEQKAVAILTTLLYLGIKNIRLGPTLPAFVSPNVLKVLVDNFGIKPIKTAEEDLKDILR
ncbi:hydroxylamine reductase [Thermodesulfovibrio yellowstonii]|uniref:Hydroxylamine reductase n=1 Tax=Thermodesulfovibrio yellowstonii (strain ATCC 51303 / DSM 11347 / YP87) TaxID=289376 RepID=HCP_THEYD|nr:hydroxylamine reductase [Thermodesulfovibrio yellowstonii]B5YHX5.1 RecName: Full=Hydroxylamine reductase; AltName: Full=Hybrid-cluster protein; Short=HCP; AltName: Full=Prismane protein [Thermodesulfovibrio yellowstonii DSM 11347]ACI20730.1 hybrid cluster protein [Thermodesulfovibrio yellowstonii DSM 11347]